MPIEKAFDPTLPRTGNDAGAEDVPLQHDDIDIQDATSAGSSELFTDSLDARMPPPLAGEGEPSPSLYGDDEIPGDDTSKLENAQAVMREKLEMADSRIKAFVERRPLVALCGAAAAGFLIGRLAARL